MKYSGRATLAAVLCALLLAGVHTVSAQITTGTVAGTVKDSQGGVIPGATVVLISESRGTRGVPAVTNATGDYVFPNTTPDTYTVEVTMSGFRTLQRTGVAVSGGERAVVGVLTIEPGGANETVNVTAEAPMIQAQSGERSFAVTTSQIESLPISGNRNFANLTSLTPGVSGTNRLGGGGQNNIMMDGISAMDTGNNGQMLQMNIESIAEVKVLSQGYQAEFGRSSGLQITAVTKSGTNRFHGSLYDIEDNSDWNTNSWVNQRNGDPKAVSKTRTWGYTVGGPVGRPGGSNKLFFFYSHEYRPSNTGGAINRFRVPTALERAGDFSETRDNNGALFPYIKDPTLSGDCSATSQAACFADGGVLGRIPANRLYQVGVNILSRYPLPTLAQAPGTNYNFELPRPNDKNLLQQPAVRMDYQMSPALRFTGKYSAQRQKRRVIPGTMSPFNDVLTPYPYITNYGITVNYTLNATTFIEGTYGSIKNELAGGGSGGILTDPSATLSSPGLAGLPLLYPNAGVIDNQGYYAYKIMQAESPVYWDSANSRIMVPPNFAWGNRIGSAPPTQTFPGFLNINKTQDVAISLTKVAGRHTIKSGFYNNHSYKAQNTGAGGVANLNPFGYINFGNDSNNALDSGFGYSNAALGIFTQYLQQQKFVEGSMIYNNTEFYLQDNWKVSNRLTLDYGLRLTRQQPQHDQFGQMSNFFPELWSPSAAPLLYVPGCSNGAVTCGGNTLNAMNPATGQILTATGAANTQAAIGTVIPGSGDIVNGIRQAGDGIADTAYVWPTVVYAPRFGFAYDLQGNQAMVFRGGVGLFYDRPDGNTIFSIPTNPPMTSSQDLRNGDLRTLGQGLSTVGVPTLSIFQYDAKVPSSTQWNAGIQMALPWASSLDVSYVGQRGFNRLAQVNLNQVNLGAAYLPEYQDTTKTTTATTVPGANAVTTNLLRPLRGLSAIQRQTTAFYDQFHSIQSSFQRRFRNGVSFGVNYTLSLSFEGNTGLTQRLQHAPDGTFSVRADQAEYEELNKQLNLQRHILRGNMVWDLPNLQADAGAMRAVGMLVNDWQLSAILTAGSGNRYDLGYTYNTAGQTVNLTGSPDYNARLRITGDLGSGCSDNQYAQFNVDAVAGPGYGSNGLESGRNYLIGCPDRTVDLSLSRNIRLGGGRAATLRLDAFNAFNVVVFNGRSTTVQYNSPTNQTLRNSQTLADGTLNPTRLEPENAGFGAVTGAQGMRTIRAQVRFSF